MKLITSLFLLPIALLAQEKNHLGNRFKFTIYKDQAAVFYQNDTITMDFMKGSLQQKNLVFEDDKIYRTEDGKRTEIGAYSNRKLTLNGKTYKLHRPIFGTTTLIDDNNKEYSLINVTDLYGRYITTDIDTSALPQEVVAWALYRSAQRTYDTLQWKHASGPALLGGSIGSAVALRH